MNRNYSKALNFRSMCFWSTTPTTMLIIMASSISTPTLSNSIAACSKPAFSFLSYTSNPNNGVFTLTSHLGLSPSCQWSGLKHLGISFAPKSINKTARRNVKFSSQVVRASLFGVGAPEALVIGVVALLVFGPKGLAEVARNLGRTLREFQPTIRELQDVSREFKNTLEREIGLDEISGQSQNTYASKGTVTSSNSSSASSLEKPSTPDDPNGAASSNRAYTSEEYLKLTEEQLKAVASQQPGETPSTSGQPQSEAQSQPEGALKQTGTTTTQPQKPESEVS